MPARPLPDKFLVAFSLAGEQRELVRAIAEAVETQLGPGTVFFDEWFEHHLAGADADLKLQKIYGEQCASLSSASPRITAASRGPRGTQGDSPRGR